MKFLSILILVALTGCSPIRVFVEENSTAEVHIHTHDAGILGVTQPAAEQVKTREGNVHFPGLGDGAREILPDIPEVGSPGTLPATDTFPDSSQTETPEPVTSIPGQTVPGAVATCGSRTAIRGVGCLWF